MKRGNPTMEKPEERTQRELAWLQDARGEGELVQEVARRVRHHCRRRRVAGGALLALALIGAIALGPFRKAADVSVASVPQHGMVQLVRAAVQVMPDGSRVELKEQAEVSVEYSAAVRRVTLIRGEAYFDVQKDRGRPFVVRVGDIEVMALGTEFAVQLGVEGVEVLVTEGTVRVSPDSPSTLTATSVSQPADTSAAPTVMDAGSQCIIGPDKVVHLTHLSESIASERLAWRVPQLELSRAPLADIVSLLNEYSRNNGGPLLVVSDPHLNQITLTGSLRVNNKEGLLRLLEANFDVVAQHSEARIILRTRR
jgi:transmembrane sensor